MNRGVRSPRLAERDGIPSGHYALKQIFCRSALVAWSHRSRFRLARRLLEPHAGRRFLDYGCGDGTLLAYVKDLFPQAVGVDADFRQICDCRRRFVTVPSIRFFTPDDLLKTTSEGAYDVVCCMEVLEHCVAEDLETVLNNLSRLVSAGGTVIVSVPIEVGPVLLGKQMVRAFAGWRSLGDYQYRERYTAPEFVRMLFATAHTSIPRPAYFNGRGWFYGHKGFNWRILRDHLETKFKLDSIRFSPLGLLNTALFNSQAWFVCTRP
jgi:2-polyprenyl-3-methyl-5-hydroxy-6-metoxy-1,4-benzoquinol methylase